MKYPFFASFIVLCMLLMYEIHKRRNKEAKKYKEFWDEEQKANSTRRKSLDDLSYIFIPESILNIEINPDDEQQSEYKNTLLELSKETIVNLTGLTNTELKLKYGAPNIDILSSYDAKYTLLARTLNDLGISLYKNGSTNESREILEFAVTTNTDVSATYDTLAKIYSESNETEKIKELIEVATNISSLMSKNIVNNLNTYLS